MAELIINDKRRFQADGHRVPGPNVIPQMNHPLSSGWDQPSTADIEVTDDTAIMTTATFKALKEYSATIPSGVYEGKMWRRNDGLFDRHFIANGGKPTWKLCWFSASEKPGFCKTNMRNILLSDGDIQTWKENI